MRITLVVADDHPIVRSGIVSLLAAESDMDIVAEAGNGLEAVAAALHHRPSAILMDLRMPELDGVGAIEQIRSEWPDAAIVALTTYDTDEAIAPRLARRSWLRRWRNAWSSGCETLRRERCRYGNSTCFARSPPATPTP